MSVNISCLHLTLLKIIIKMFDSFQEFVDSLIYLSCHERVLE